MRIIIGADIVPMKSNYELFTAGEPTALVGQPLYDVLRAADYRIFNLEVPLRDKERK